MGCELQRMDVIVATRFICSCTKYQILINPGLGAFVGGIVADLFGRKLSFKISFLIVIVSLITLSVCGTVQIFSLGLFLLGILKYDLTLILVDKLLRDLTV